MTPGPIGLQLIATPQGPIAGEPARSFEDDSVTIGRAPNCQVVLPDGLRIISRQHVRLSRQGGEVLLGCLSASAPVHVNQVGVPHGGMLPLSSGDVIRIGGFELRFSLQPAAAQGLRPAPESLAERPAAMPPTPAAAPTPRPASPVAPLGARPATPQPPPAPAPARPGRARLDEWFDLEPPAPPPADAVPPAVAWAATAEVDLDLRSGAQPPTPAGAEQRIFASLQQVLGPRAEAPAQVAPTQVAPDSAPAALHAPEADPLAEATPALPAARAAIVAPAAPAAEVVAPAVEPEAAPAEPHAADPDVGHAAAPPARAPRQAPPLDDAARALLMQAFMEGAGLGPRTGTTSTQMVAPMALTPEWMRHIGELLRASVEGLLALLHSRSTVKREMRAEVTVIARRQNNPLKFAPDALAALAHLLAAKRTPGFLEPVAALKDAHEDLLVHHLAVVAGMRAAMFELIARLGPDDVVRDEGPPKGLSTLPTLHEAALWRRYRQRHAEMTARLDDDFETVFGREFTKAYEAQARRVRDKASPEDAGTGTGGASG